MIGVRLKKKKESETDAPDTPQFNLQEGQGAIYGIVTKVNPLDNSINPEKDVQVSVIKDNVLIGFSITFDDGYYQIDAIDAPADYRMEFTKNGTYHIPEFRLESKEVKQINVELS
jgi:hypothetical protein